MVMRALGFADPWVSLIMGCVSSIQYNILLNGQDAGIIHPTRDHYCKPFSLFVYPVRKRAYSNDQGCREKEAATWSQNL
ncbi:hypothetical protein SLA2020_033350 [Shorea laevis]